MGGYVCFPGGWMAWLLRQAAPARQRRRDAAAQQPRCCSRSRDASPSASPASRARDAGAKAVVTGNPVRAEIEAIAEPAARFAGRAGALRLLVVGGSLGARVLNEKLPQAIALMTAAERPRVTHQTGEAGRDARAAPPTPRAGVDAEVLPFIDDMARAPGRLRRDRLPRRRDHGERAVRGRRRRACWCRFVASTTSHQRDNAAWMAAARRGASTCRRASSRRGRLADLLSGLTRDALLAMATKARALARPHAAARVADEIEAMVAA